MKKIILGACLLTVLFISQTPAQVIIMPYTIQGFLKDGNVPANGNYDISYTLYDTDTSTTIVGGNNHLNVPVVNGVFSFEESGYASFHTPGRTLWIEFGFKPAYSQQPYTIVAPRQRLGAVPFSISSLISLDSMKLGGALASQYVLTTDSRLSDARPPTAGSTNYVQNTTTQQATSNFNISGTGNANILQAQTEYWLGGARIMRRVGDSFMVGDQAGANTSVIWYNTFFGTRSGRDNTTGQGNSFFGKDAGLQTQTASGNSYFGENAGRNRMGNNNSVFGSTLPISSPLSTGDFNSFFGHRAGELTMSGSLNSFFGTGAGFNNNSGSSNTFVGHDAGTNNLNGSFNTALGEFANFGGNSLTNATAIGYRATVGQNNSLVLGSINGLNGATADTSVGIGTTMPAAKFHVNGNVRVTNGGIFVANPNTLVITSPNGACWGITVNNSGGLATFPVNPCP